MSKNKVIDWETYRNSRLGGSVPRSLFDDVDPLPLAGKPARIAPYVACHTTHKPLAIDTYFIYGGSCSAPKIKDADIYVGFERGMETYGKNYPWDQGDAFQFLIVDGSVPTNVQDFKNLITYLSDNLKANKKIHIGCIGGHGRTGLVLSALVCHMTGNKDSTTYVRTNYCAKAVETTVQIDWLHKHFGIIKTTPTKPNHGAYGGSSDLYRNYGNSKGISKTYSELDKSRSSITTGGATLFETIKPVRVKGSVWGF